MSFCMLLTFGFSHHVSVFSNLSRMEKASVKDEGRLLTDCAYEALTLWVSVCFLNFSNAIFTCILSGATGSKLFSKVTSRR